MSTEKDPKGYYACLGVAPEASAEEIKSAYRQIAKKLHPDINRDPSAKTQFQRANEAYSALNDPGARNAYDALRYSKPSPQPRKDELNPICCSHCGKVTAQPRAKIFFRVTSFLFVTIKTPIQGIFCSSCATKLALRASAISAFLGWWGFPWGPIWTIGSILTNATGGKDSQDINDKLTWFNALAFLSHGNLAIAYALALQSRSAKTPQIASDAEELINHLRAAGVPPSSPSLKNPWSNPSVAMAQIGLLLLIPGTIGLVIALDNLSKGSKRAYTAPSYTPSTQQSPTPPAAIMPKPDFSKYADTTPPTLQTAPLIPICNNPPYNGQILAKNLALNSKGHSIEIKNGAGANAVIKIRDAIKGTLKLSFFVAKGNTAAITNIPDGMYRIQYAFGSEFGIDCRSFVRVSSAAQFPDMETLLTQYEGNQIIRARLSYTLYSVPGGNVRPQNVDLASFNAD